MARKFPPAEGHTPGLPTKSQILEYIKESPTTVGKRDIARAFGLKGQEKIKLKSLLKDMADEGLIDGRKTAFHEMGGLPKVTVLRVVDIDDGDPIAVPDNWSPADATPPPRVRLIERKGKSTALRKGERVLARTEETRTGWIAHPMKKLAVTSDQMLGVVEVDSSGKAWLAPTDRRIRYSSPIKDLFGAEAGQLVLAEPAGRSERAGVNVIEVLGDPLAPRSFSLIAIHKHGIPDHFSEATLEAAELAAKLPLSEEKREDLRAVPIVAIDPVDARDHDDAIWAEPDGKGGFRAIVAIADVSFYVRPGSAIDKEARKRGNSVYFPDRVVPMLPEVLSADVCSLKQDVDRAAMACHLTIDAEGRVTDWRFTRAIVRLAANIAYEDAQAQIDSGEASANLRNLWDCWKVLASARERREPLELEIPEKRVVLDDQGRITQIAERERLDAHRVVEDFMIAANVAAAKALESKAAQVVYRLHETPGREKLLSLKDYLATFDRKLAMGQVITPGTFNRMLKDITDESESVLIMEAVLRSQTQAYYGPRNLGHFGLALGSYAHFTSPIRRYSDLLVHRLLVETFGLEQPAPKTDVPATTGLSDKDRSNLGKICEAISDTERRAMAAERETTDRYVAAWLASRVGEVFETRITGVQKFGFFATIIGLGGDGLVPVSTLGDERFVYNEKAQTLEGERSGIKYAIGDRLRLRLAEANPLTGALKYELEDGASASIEPRGNRLPVKHKGKHMVGRRGRPANIRHQGRKK